MMLCIPSHTPSLPLQLSLSLLTNHPNPSYSPPLFQYPCVIHVRRLSISYPIPSMLSAPSSPSSKYPSQYLHISLLTPLPRNVPLLLYPATSFTYNSIYRNAFCQCIQVSNTCFIHFDNVNKDVHGMPTYAVHPCLVYNVNM